MSRPILGSPDALRGFVDHLRHDRRARTLFLVRWALPALCVVVGAIIMTLGTTDGGFSSKSDGTAAAGLVIAGTGVMVWMLSWMFRMSVDSNRDREDEERAREYFDEHGRWPDEA